MNKSLLLCAAIAGLAACAQAAVTNVNLSWSAEPGGTQALNGTAWNPTVAPLAYIGSTWNDTRYHYSGDVDGNPLNNLLDSTGAASGVGFNLTGWTDVADNWSGSIKLLQGGYYTTAGTMTLTVSGLEVGNQYDLYLAANANNDHGANFTIGGQSKLSFGTNTTSFVEGENYARFSGLTPDASGNIVVAIAASPSHGVPVLDGFQISAVPEPTSLAALGLSGLMMLRRKRS